MDTTSTSTGRTAGTAGRAAGWVAPLCWIAVLLDGFDLVVVGTVIPTLRTPEESGRCPAPARPRSSPSGWSA
jgi:hypothetical protein